MNPRRAAFERDLEQSSGSVTEAPASRRAGEASTRRSWIAPANRAAPAAWLGAGDAPGPTVPGGAAAFDASGCHCFLLVGGALATWSGLLRFPPVVPRYLPHLLTP